MSDFISDEVYNAIQGKMDIPDTAYLLEQLDVESGRYQTEGVVLSRALAMTWVLDNDSTVKVNGIPYATRRYGRMRILHSV